MAEAVADMLFRFGADISDLKTKLDEANARLNQMGAQGRRAHREMKEGFESLRHPITEIGRLTGALGEAFGEANLKGTKMIRELVLGLGSGSAVIVGTAALGALVTTLIGKFGEEGEAARKAAEKARDARVEENKRIDETIKKLDEEIKRRNLLLKGESPTFAAAQTGADNARLALEQAAQTREANRGVEENLRKQLADLNAQRSEAVADAAGTHAAAAAGRQFDDQIRQLAQTLERIVVENANLDAQIPRLTEAAKLSRENVEGAAISEISTPITPETLTPAGGQAKGLEKSNRDAEAAARKRREAEEQAARELADLRLSIAEGENEKALAAYQNRLDQIDLKEKTSDANKAAEKEAAFRDLQDTLGRIEADRIERTAGASKTAAREQHEAFDEAATAAKQSTQELISLGQTFGSAIADFLVAPLTEGFASIADFAKKAGALVLSLAADLVKAAVVAAILSALTGGSATALAGVGGLTGAIGHALSIKGFAEGGRVGSTDTVPAMLTPGEFVMPVSAVQRFGVGFFEDLRRRGRLGFADGGLVPAGAGGGNVTVYSQSFDEPAIARNSARLDNVQTRRINNRQGALLRETLRRNLRG